jgi:hypothetical protein
MVVPVMQIRRLRMTMRDGLVRVLMRVRLAAIPREGMDMPMMVVVNVVVVVLDWRVQRAPAAARSGPMGQPAPGSAARLF